MAVPPPPQGVASSSWLCLYTLVKTLRDEFYWDGTGYHLSTCEKYRKFVLEATALLADCWRKSKPFLRALECCIKLAHVLTPPPNPSMPRPGKKLIKVKFGQSRYLNSLYRIKRYNNLKVCLSGKQRHRKTMSTPLFLSEILWSFFIHGIA